MDEYFYSNIRSIRFTPNIYEDVTYKGSVVPIAVFLYNIWGSFVQGFNNSL